METTEPTSLKNDLDAVFLLARKGEISKCSKTDLERYAAVLCSTEIRTRLRDPELSQIGETVRTLLIVRMSEEVNKEATRISKIALGVAMAALGCTVLQVFASWWR